MKSRSLPGGRLLRAACRCGGEGGIGAVVGGTRREHLQPRRQRRDRWILEQLDDRRRLAEGPLQPRVDVDQLQRMPTDVEEILVDTDLRLQYILPNAGDQLFTFIARYRALDGCGLSDRRRQRADIELAVRGHRQVVE